MVKKRKIKIVSKKIRRMTKRKQVKEAPKIIFIVLGAVFLMAMIGAIFFKSLYSEANFRSLNPMSDEQSLNCVDVFYEKNETVKNAEFVITNQEQYQALTKYIRNSSDCKSYKLPEIDFSANIVLGKYTGVSGCNIDFQRKILVSHALKKVRYLINMETEGKCEHLLMSMNWAITEKIPENYTVEFEINN